MRRALAIAVFVAGALACIATSCAEPGAGGTVEDGQSHGVGAVVVTLVATYDDGDVPLAAMITGEDGAFGVSGKPMTETGLREIALTFERPGFATERRSLGKTTADALAIKQKAPLVVVLQRAP